MGLRHFTYETKNYYGGTEVRISKWIVISGKVAIGRPEDFKASRFYGNDG
jgi:hypothetical protein